jgi:dienelactone hydrolase
MRQNGLALLAAAVALASVAASAEVKTKEIQYKQGGTPLQGFIAWDDAVKGKRPGVLVVHEWWGLNEHARNQARRLAEAGYVGLALDMYGKGKSTQHPDDAGKMATELNKDPKQVKARFDAALAQLKKDPHVDAKKIGVVGYCMGGTIALSMAGAGEPLGVVAAFHAGLQNLPKPKQGQVKARILLNTGAADPMAPQSAVDAFKQSFEGAGAKVEVISYPGAKHGFTNPDADKAGMPALAYNAEADKESWANSMQLFKDVFGS